MTIVCNANIGLAIGYQLLLVVSISNIGTCQKPILVHLQLVPPSGDPWATVSATLQTLAKTNKS